MHPSIPLVFLATRVHCWRVVNLLSTGTAKSFSEVLQSFSWPQSGLWAALLVWSTSYVKQIRIWQCPQKDATHRDADPQRPILLHTSTLLPPFSCHLVQQKHLLSGCRASINSHIGGEETWVWKSSTEINIPPHSGVVCNQNKLTKYRLLNTFWRWYCIISIFIIKQFIFWTIKLPQSPALLILSLRFAPIGVSLEIFSFIFFQVIFKDHAKHQDSIFFYEHQCRRYFAKYLLVNIQRLKIPHL